MRQRKIICHVGMRKTASTSIQSWLNQIDGVDYIGKTKNRGEFKTERIGYELENVLSHSSSLVSENWIGSSLQTHSDMSSNEEGVSGIISLINEDSEMPLVMSSESFLGPMPFPHDPRLNLSRLSKVIGSDAIVLVFLREQFSFLKSQYGIMVRHGYPASYRTYIDQIVRRAHTGTLPALAYFTLCKAIKDIFPNSIILPIESFLVDKSVQSMVRDSINPMSKLPELPKFNRANYKMLGALRFVNKYIFKYMLGNAEEAAFGDLEWSVMRRNLESFGAELDLIEFDKTRRKAHKVARLLSAVIPSPTYVSQYDSKLQEMFAEQNRRLQEHMGLPLREHGYLV